MKPAKSAQKKTRDEKVESSTVQEALFPLVGIGASAGGLEAFEKFFAHMPTDIGVAFILVPHLDPGHASMMTDQHINKENQVLFPMSEKVLPKDVQAKIAEGFEKIEAEKIGMGTHEELHKLLEKLEKIYLK
jgi:hypothetical protein